MPTYSYECSFCNIILERSHSMTESLEGGKCPNCAKRNALNKLPSYFTKFYKTDGSVKTEKKVGDVVKAAIKELTEDLYNYEDELADEVYESDQD